ncbi:wu:fc23c09 [Brachionichthys hirsutus]|uniref:wu:fc23c09 n=1 Tax=Brachionichthys hirsutus TaxID=412623 RepID=UPI0036050C4F
MEALTLLLVSFTVSGYSFVLQPSEAVRQMAELERETPPVVKNEQLKAFSIFVEEEEETGHYSERKKTEEGPKNPEKMEEKVPAGFDRSEGGYKDRLTPGTFAKMLEEGKERDTEKDFDEDTREEVEKNEEGEKDVLAPMPFPYFLDTYCPPECACYGRVVQCSDKGVDKVPYGIPYNARYVLLMNNRIDGIQLDLLNEYASMEFLVLSNNRLTDGAIEGAFEGIPALKRLYLDRNRLISVPTDLPVSLEELRLDSNQLSVMSEAAWSRCPSLLVLSLSNNSLGNGSDSLPDGALSPLSSLRTLNLDHNQIAVVPLGLPLSIKELYLKGNLIEQFPGGVFKGISETLVLDLSRNRLSNKGLLLESLLNVTCLESLNLEGNVLKKVPGHLPHSLKTLNLEGNLIYSIKKGALSSLKNLEHLGLARNKIIKVAPGAFNDLPILHQLDLSYNTLHQVPRQLPRALHSVALAHNKIRSVPRDAFCWGDQSLGLSRLVRVRLEHNLIEMGELDVQAFRCLRGFQVVHFF